MSNPVIYYLKWVVSETVGGFNAGKSVNNQEATRFDMKVNNFNRFDE